MCCSGNGVDESDDGGGNDVDRGYPTGGPRKGVSNVDMFVFVSAEQMT